MESLIVKILRQTLDQDNHCQNLRLLFGSLRLCQQQNWCFQKLLWIFLRKSSPFHQIFSFLLRHLLVLNLDPNRYMIRASNYLDLISSCVVLMKRKNRMFITVNRLEQENKKCINLKSQRSILKHIKKSEVNSNYRGHNRMSENSPWQKQSWILHWNPIRKNETMLTHHARAL